MKRKLISLLLCLGMMSSLLAGCGQEGGGTEPDGQKSEETAPNEESVQE